MGELIVPASIAIFTDSAGLFVLTVSSIPIIAKLGYFCSFWSLSNLVTVSILVPLVLSYLPAPKTFAEQGADGGEKHKNIFSKIMSTWGGVLVSPKAPLPIFGIAGIIIAFSLV